MNRAQRRAEAARQRSYARARARLIAVAELDTSPILDMPAAALAAYKRRAITRDQAKALGAFVSRKQSASAVTPSLPNGGPADPHSTAAAADASQVQP